MASQNGIVGDDFGTVLPETEVPDTALDEEKKLARYSKTAEFKRLRDYFQSRIEFYQSFLPDGRPLTEAGKTASLNEWIIANQIIAEFNNVIAEYDRARETVDSVER